MTNQQWLLFLTLTAFSKETHKTNSKSLFNHSDLSETAWYPQDLREPSDLSDLRGWSPRIEGSYSWITQNWARRLFLRVAIYLLETLWRWCDVIVITLEAWHNVPMRIKSCSIILIKYATDIEQRKAMLAFNLVNSNLLSRHNHTYLYTALSKHKNVHCSRHH